MKLIKARIGKKALGHNKNKEMCGEGKVINSK